MTSTEKTAAAVSKLIRRTQEGELVWRAVAPMDAIADAQDRVRACFEASVEGQRLVLYEAARSYSDEYERQHYKSYVGLVVLDTDGGVTWRFPFVSGLDDLFKEAGYVAGNMDEFFESLLKPDA